MKMRRKIRFDPSDDTVFSRAAAAEEVAFAAGLCAHPVNTAIAVARELDEDGDA